jgi:hypothetical protein
MQDFGARNGLDTEQSTDEKSNKSTGKREIVFDDDM